MIAIVTLWILLILSAFSLSVSSKARSQVELTRFYVRKLESYQVAVSALTLGRSMIDRDATPHLDHLSEPWYRSPDVFENIHMRAGWFNIAFPNPAQDEREPHTIYGVEDEDSKININEAPAGVLRGIPGITVEIAAAILDWRDADDKTRPRGAEQNTYASQNEPYLCANDQFKCVEELLMVNGMNAETFETVKPFVTVYGDDAVNVMTATVEVLAALGIPDGVAKKIAEFRAKPDNIKALSGKNGPDVNHFIRLLTDQRHVKASEQTLLRSYFTLGKLKFTSDVFRLRCEGIVPAVSTEIEPATFTKSSVEVVYERERGWEGSGENGKFVYWREE